MGRTKCESIVAVASVSDGNHFSIADEFTDEGIPYYRGQDVVGNFFIERGSPQRISAAAYHAAHMHRSHLQIGDVLVSIIGTIGEASIVTAPAPATCSCKLAILRPHSVPPAYLATVLRSSIGRSQTERFTRGAVQMGLLLEDMDQIHIPRQSEGFETAIVDAGGRAQELLKRVENGLAHSEAMLLSALGLRTWQPPEPLTYTRRAPEVMGARRFDAVYFTPEKKYATDALARLGGPKLGEVFTSARDMFSPGDCSTSMQVRNFDVTHALQPELTDETPPVPASEIGSMKKRMRNGDVAISRLRAYLREIAIVRTSETPPTVGSSEFVVLRPKGRGKPLSPEALLVFLRSRPVQAVLKWCRDGSQHPRFDENDLLAIPVPDLLWHISDRLAEQVSTAFAARREATALLEKAKRAVEIAIEDSEAAALQFLAKQSESSNAKP